MTIICATLGHEWIAVASDSYRTDRKDDESVVVKDDQSPKLVGIKNDKFHGALSWCGYCGEKADGSDDILHWFRKHAQLENGVTAEKFANTLTQDLNNFYEEYSARWKQPIRHLLWIAVHLAVFEWIEELGEYVPELFYIHNVNGAYEHSGAKVICQRHTRLNLLPTAEAAVAEHGELKHRKFVFESLRTNDLLVNNPNPKIAAPLQELVKKKLKVDEVTGSDWYERVTREPIVYAAHILRFGAEGNTKIGGAVHSMLISKNGTIVEREPIQPV